MGATGMWSRKVDTASTGDPQVLVVVEGADRRTIVLDHFPFTIGRRTDRDLVMADPRVSREHAQFITRDLTASTSSTRAAATEPSSMASASIAAS